MATTTPEENKRIGRRIPGEVANQGTPDRLDDILADDVIDHTPLGETLGREAAKKLFAQLHDTFPDLEVTVEELIAERDTVAVWVTWHATHEGEFMGIQPTGEGVEVAVIVFLRIENGKAVEEWQFVDTLGMLEQLGVVDPPP